MGPTQSHACPGSTGHTLTENLISFNVLRMFKTLLRTGGEGARLLQVHTRSAVLSGAAACCRSRLGHTPTLLLPRTEFHGACRTQSFLCGPESE